MATASAHDPLRVKVTRADDPSRCFRDGSVLLLVDHAVQAACLPLNALEPAKAFLTVVGIPLRDMAIPVVIGVVGGRCAGSHGCPLLAGECILSRYLPKTSVALTPGRKSSRRSSWALSATTTVDADIKIAPTDIGRTNPIPARTPAARGTEMRL